MAVVRVAVTEEVGRATTSWASGERLVIPSMFSRGVATAVMAFLPISMGLSETELFPIYALTVIMFSVVGMTFVLTLYQRWSPSSRVEPAPNPPPHNAILKDELSSGDFSVCR